MHFTHYAEIHEFFMRELRLVHAPVGMRFFFDDAGLESFRKAYEHYAPVKPLTFCQAELGARMEGLTIVLDMDKLWCQGARFVFGLRDMEEADLRLHRKFCTDDAQARRVLESKPRLTGKKLLAVALSPLGAGTGQPDVVHFCCDNMQAYHILNDWMAVRNVHPLRPVLCVNSAICGGSVFSFVEAQANLTLACAGSYNSGKMERGEINVMVPGGHIRDVAERMAARVAEKGGISLTREGRPLPGPDICQNCPLIAFRKAE